jgi:hypothetical protein
MLVLRRIGFHAGALLLTLALPRLAAADCKTEPIHPCGEANKGECMLCSCADGKQYTTIRALERGFSPAAVGSECPSTRHAGWGATRR